MELHSPVIIPARALNLIHTLDAGCRNTYSTAAVNQVVSGFLWSESLIGFVVLYAACKVPQHGSKQGAISILGLASDDVLCREMLQVLLGHEASPKDKAVWSGIEYFDAWSHSRYAIWQRQCAIQAIRKTFKSIGVVPTSPHPTILDIGCGNGILTAQVVNALTADYHLDRCRLVIVDMLPDALEAARAICASSIQVDCEIVPIVKQLEELDISAIANHSWFIHCAATLHHLPYMEKVRAARSMIGSSNALVLTEIEGNHDIHEPCSPELVYSVWLFYSCLIRDVLASRLTDEQKRACITGFLIPEAYNLLFADYKHRLNYHLLEKDWRSLLAEAGADVVAIERRIRGSKCPSTLTMVAKRS